MQIPGAARTTSPNTAMASTTTIDNTTARLYDVFLRRVGRPHGAPKNAATSAWKVCDIPQPTEGKPTHITGVGAPAAKARAPHAHRTTTSLRSE